MKTNECIRLLVSPLSVSLNETHRLAISVCGRSATKLNNCPCATRISESVRRVDFSCENSSHTA